MPLCTDRVAEQLYKFGWKAGGRAKVIFLVVDTYGVLATKPPPSDIPMRLCVLVTMRHGIRRRRRVSCSRFTFGECS